MVKTLWLTIKTLMVRDFHPPEPQCWALWPVIGQSLPSRPWFSKVWEQSQDGEVEVWLSLRTLIYAERLFAEFLPNNGKNILPTTVLKGSIRYQKYAHVISWIFFNRYAYEECTQSRSFQARWHKQVWVVWSILRRKQQQQQKLKCPEKRGNVNQLDADRSEWTIPLIERYSLFN